MLSHEEKVVVAACHSLVDSFLYEPHWRVERMAVESCELISYKITHKITGRCWTLNLDVMAQSIETLAHYIFQSIVDIFHSSDCHITMAIRARTMIDQSSYGVATFETPY